MKIRCKTLFDCSATGVTGHFRAAEIPFQDHLGNVIENLDHWNLRRNQQRNWETLLQVIGLRCQLEDIVTAQRQQDHWEFEFGVSQIGVLGEDHDFESVYRDCAGVPMITGLEERAGVQPVICISGPERNIWFETINTA